MFKKQEKMLTKSNPSVGLNRSAVVADRCNDRGVIIMPPLRDD